MDIIPQTEVIRLLSTLISQLLQNNEERLNSVYSSLISKGLTRTTFRQPGDFSLSSTSVYHWNPEELWKLLYASITAVPSRQVTILIDAIHTFSMEARQTVLGNIVRLQEEVRLQGVKGLKIFATWKPEIDIQQKLRETPSLEIEEVKRKCDRSYFTYLLFVLTT